MPIKSSGYYNNPQFAQAANNLASLFEPPSGSDAAGYALANERKAAAQRLADFYDYAKQPDFNQQQFDRLGVASGAYQPNQSYYSVDQGNATTQRGQDITAATSRANNAADNARALEVGQIGGLADLYKPVGEGEVRPAIPQDVAGRFGVTRDLPAEQGREKPLTEDQLKATILGTLPRSQQEAAAFGNTPVENIVTPNGPRIATRLDAIGQEPAYEPKGNGITTTLTDGTVIQVGGNAKPTEASDKAGIFFSRAAPASANLDAAVANGYQPNDLDYESSLGAASGLPNAVTRHAISDNGRKFYSDAQNFMMSILRPDTGAAFGKEEFQSYAKVFIPMPGDPPDLIKAKSIARQTALAALRGTSRGAAEQIAGILAQQGLPVPKEMAAVIARGGVGGGKAPVPAAPAQAAAPASAATPAPAAPAVGDIPVVSSPEEAAKLPSGTQFKTPDGRIKVRP